MKGCFSLGGLLSPITLHGGILARARSPSRLAPLPCQLNLGKLWEPIRSCCQLQIVTSNKEKKRIIMNSTPSSSPTPRRHESKPNPEKTAESKPETKTAEFKPEKPAEFKSEKPAEPKPEKPVVIELVSSDPEEAAFRSG